MINKYYVIYIVLLFVMPDLMGRDAARDLSSTVQVAPEAQLVIEENIQDYEGTLEVSSNNSVVGKDVAMNNGVLKENNKKTKVTGTIKENSILLDGGKKIRGDGVRMSKDIIISGTGNLIEGELLAQSDIVFSSPQDIAVFALTRSLDQNINLNNGLLELGENLCFVCDKKIKGPGICKLNNYRLQLGPDSSDYDTSIYYDNAHCIELNANMTLSGIWTFSGDNNCIIGNGYVLSLAPGGSLVVEKGSSLFLHNIVIDHIGNGNLRCFDNTSSITFQDVVLRQDADYTFSLGSFNIFGTLGVYGNHIFTYQTSMTSTIHKNATFYLDEGVTLSYAPLRLCKYLIEFEHHSSKLYLDGSDLYVSQTGIQFKKGTIIIDKNVSFNAEFGNFSDSGITLGDNDLIQDCLLKILNGAVLSIDNGYIIYNNVSQNGIQFVNTISTLKMKPGTYFVLDQTFNAANGRIRIPHSATLIKNSGKEFFGSVEIIPS